MSQLISVQYKSRYPQISSGLIDTSKYVCKNTQNIQNEIDATNCLHVKINKANKSIKGSINKQVDLNEMAKKGLSQ